VTTHDHSTQEPQNTQSHPVSAGSANSAFNVVEDIPLLEPDTAAELAAMLRRASDQRQSIVIRGAGTKMDWGRAPQRVDAILSTRRLNRLLAHAYGDLTATIEAGATLAEVNATLARRGQCLPLDPPFADRATIGGILATNDSGPLRHRFGTPRDLVIGVQLATTDGTLAKAGGQVVKNVAGYDLSKLVCGSFGSLAAIVSATFKLTPLPRASKTIVIEAPDVERLGQIVRDVMSSQLEPIAFDIHVSDVARLLLRFASLPNVVDAQIEQTLALAALKGLGAPKRQGREGGCATAVTEDDAERAVWEERSRRMWDSPGAIVRASWMPADLPAALKGATRVTELAGRAAVGAGLIRIDGDVRTQAAAIEQLRQSTSFRNVVIVRGSDELKSIVDVWGPLGDRERLFASLKHALDPNGILNAGRGPL
jgi:glycolate oxidase FAD binding subunit